MDIRSQIDQEAGFHDLECTPFVLLSAVRFEWNVVGDSH